MERERGKETGGKEEMEMKISLPCGGLAGQQRERAKRKCLRCRLTSNQAVSIVLQFAFVFTQGCVCVCLCVCGLAYALCTTVCKYCLSFLQPPHRLQLE